MLPRLHRVAAASERRSRPSPAVPAASPPLLLDADDASCKPPPPRTTKPIDRLERCQREHCLLSEESSTSYIALGLFMLKGEQRVRSDMLSSRQRGDLVGRLLLRCGLQMVTPASPSSLCPLSLSPSLSVAFSRSLSLHILLIIGCLQGATQSLVLWLSALQCVPWQVRIILLGLLVVDF